MSFLYADAAHAYAIKRQRHVRQIQWAIGKLGTLASYQEVKACLLLLRGDPELQEGKPVGLDEAIKLLRLVDRFDQSLQKGESQ